MALDAARLSAEWQVTNYSQMALEFLAARLYTP
jgi:hypothetical protein